MICKKCHVHVEDGTEVCPVCGAEMEPEEALTEEVPVEESAVAEVEITEVIADEEAVEEITEEELDAPKRKSWVKVTAIVCCVALFLGLAASIWFGVNGGFKLRTNDVYYKDQYNEKADKAVKAADDIIATVGDKELTNGQFQIFYWMSVYEFYQQYSSYLSYFGLDISQPLSEQYVEEGGATWEQFFIDGALNTWHNYQSLLLRAETDGYAMSELLTQQLEAVNTSMETGANEYGFANATEMIQAEMGPAADIDSYMYYMGVYYAGMEYFESLYDQVSPTDAEIEAYYTANADSLLANYSVDKESGKLIDVRHILICPKGGTQDENGETTYSQDEWDACLLEAESLLKQWQEGEATEEAFAVLASEATEDPGSQSTGGLYSYVYEGQMVPAFNDWCFDESRQYGDTGIVKTNYGYHIMYFVYGEEGWIRYARDSLITEACSKVMKQAMEEYPLEVNYKNIVIGRLEEES